MYFPSESLSFNWGVKLLVFVINIDMFGLIPVIYFHFLPHTFLVSLPDSLSFIAMLVICFFFSFGASEALHLILL